MHHINHGMSYQLFVIFHLRYTIPLARTRLLSSDEYVANTTFLRSTTWYSNMAIDYLHEAHSYSMKECSLVGIVSNTNLKMERHGDFDPSVDNSMENAQLRFMVVAPPKDSPFSRDFQSFHNHIRILVDLLNPAATLHPFVTRGDKVDDISFNFSHRLFKVKSVSGTIFSCLRFLLNSKSY